MKVWLDKFYIWWDQLKPKAKWTLTKKRNNFDNVRQKINIYKWDYST